VSDTPILLAEPDLEEHKGFILAEEAALKQYLTGWSVPKVSGTPGERIPIKVWYRFPESERQIEYPFICIDFLSAEPAFDLFHSTHVHDAETIYRPSFAPNLPDPPAGWNRATWLVYDYLPFRLTFQVSTYTRSNLHDRYLTSIFLTDVLPVRPFFITVGADHVQRRVEQVGFAQANVPETSESGTKRIFRKYYTITMLTDIPQNYFTEEHQAWKVLKVLIPVTTIEAFDSYRRTFLDGHSDPLNEFTRDEREAGGELFNVVHEGEEIPTAQ
jgi:hypothetical protein